MGCFSRAYFALLRRNIIYRKRNILGSLIEIILPVGFICILLGIKIALKGSDGFSSITVPASFPGDSRAIIPLSFRDYVTSIQAKRSCQPSMLTKQWPFQVSAYFDNQNPFLKCDRRSCIQNGEDATLFCEYLILAIAPKDETSLRGLARAQAFQGYIESTYPQLVNGSFPAKYPFVQRFGSDADIASYVKSPNYGKTGFPKVGFAVVFLDGSSEKDYAYTLRQNSTNFNIPEEDGRPAQSTSPPTNQVFSFFRNLDNACPPTGGTADQGPLQSSCTGQYLYNGAITVQRTIQDWILVDSGSADQGMFVSEHGVQFVSFPTREFTINGFYASIAAYAPLLIALGLLYPVASILRSVVQEKELRQKELMKMMSVTESDIGWSWFTSFFFFHLITAVASAAASASLYERSSFSILLVFWVLAFTAIITFSFAVSSLFSKATTATLVGVLVFFVGYFLTSTANFKTGSAGAISIVSIHPVAAIAYGMQEIGRLEDAGIGLIRSTISTTDSPSRYTFVNTLSSLAISCLIWGFFSFYVNRVKRSEYGQSLPWYFMCSKSYWCTGRSTGELSDDLDAAAYGVPVEEVSDAVHASIKEGKGIAIRGLRKQFGEKTAVDNLNLTMYSNQITALLGHNGAGKTTTISILTGMLAPSNGYAIVGGRDVRTDMSKIRQETGICLQHDCLFPQLTVVEHIQFFSRVKGLYNKYPKKEVEAKILRSIEDVALLEKRNTLSKNLSGGMKRKLSLAIAFCGESKTVLLDEPTSGMDPFSRRFTWDVIRQYRQDRCIVLTTHFMDEADILGDRIAIMAEGQLRCAGSSLFLKKHYGVGYQLTIERNAKVGTAGTTDANSDDKQIDDDAEEEYCCDDDVDLQVTIPGTSLEKIVLGAVPEATLLNNVGTALSFQLPIGAAAKFTRMFQKLDQQMDSKNIVTYGVSITTLDEVFLLVARGETGEKVELKSSRAGGGTLLSDEDKSIRSKMNLDNNGLFMRHVQSLFLKRALNFKRDKKAWVCSTLLPSFLVLIGFLLYTFAAAPRPLDALELSMKPFNPSVNSQPRNPIPFNEPGTNFKCQPGVCMVAFNGTLPLAMMIGNTNQSDLYTFCGIGLNGNITSSCSISESSNIVERILEDGVGGVPQNNTDIQSSSENIFESSKVYAGTQFGALHFTHDRASQTEGQNYSSLVIGKCAEFVSRYPQPYYDTAYCERYGGVGYVVNYNYTALHASLIYQAVADEALLREAMNDDELKISAIVHPLPLTDVELSLGAAEDAFTAWFLVVLSFPFIAGTFATFIVTERSSKAKHLQTVAGVQPTAYWLSSYMWDVMNYQLPLWITIAVMFGLNVEPFTTSERSAAAGTIVSLVLFGPAAAGFTYCVSFAFTSPSLCNLFVIITSFLIGLAGPLVSLILRIIGDPSGLNNPSFITVANTVEWVLRFFPSFNLGSSLLKIINVLAFEGIAREPITVWHSSMLLYETIFQAIWCFVYIFLAILLDKWSTNPRTLGIWQGLIRIVTCRWMCEGFGSKREVTLATSVDDEDVAAEKERVASGEANNDNIVIDQLTKVYGNGKMAVNSLSLGIPPGQCFGLLGINGAGKTTTMGILTGEFPPTSGDATLAGFSVTREPEKTRRRVGYCPQFDAHFQNMTGREHVQLYAAIKGLPAQFVRDAVQQKLAEVGLSDFDSDRVSSGYSGGMKRKLSVACATIGQPQLVFLDEPSTGMDPVARRDLWAVISDMVTGGNIPDEERTSVILTTHSMEECEALCPRIGVMANGRLSCVGSAQHLKSRFGQGYQVEMKTKAVATGDQDYVDIRTKLADFVGASATVDAEEGISGENYVNLSQILSALKSLTDDESLSSMVNVNDANGYIIYKSAASPVGCSLEELASFATSEIRMMKLDSFFRDNFEVYVLRERQSNKARYEVGLAGVRISSIFAKIESNKEILMLEDYGVSQTSLEQVFNMHAAEAEKLKQGRNDS